MALFLHTLGVLNGSDLNTGVPVPRTQTPFARWQHVGELNNAGEGVPQASRSSHTYARSNTKKKLGPQFTGMGAKRVTDCVKDANRSLWVLRAGRLQGIVLFYFLFFFSILFLFFSPLPFSNRKQVAGSGISRLIRFCFVRRWQVFFFSWSGSARPRKGLFGARFNTLVVQETRVLLFWNDE